MSRPQPYRIDWTLHPYDFDELNARLGTQFESVDQMFQMLFEDLAGRVTALDSEVTGVLPVIRGGTNATGVTIGGVAYGSSGAVTGAAYAFSAAGVAGQVLLSNGTGAPTFGAVSVTGTGITGILPIANGGTNGTGAPTTGGIAYGDGVRYAFSAAGTAGHFLQSSGTAAPKFVRIDLASTGVSGILPLANGGTNASGAAVTGGVIYSDATKWLATAAGTAGHFLMSSGTAAPVFSQINLATTGVSGILPVGNGGTGLSTLAAGRIPYGSGASPLNSTGTFVFDGTKLSFPGQLQFPATQAASADANCLDDYEEGSWTPTIGGSSGQSGQVYSFQLGLYSKVGNQVTIWYALQLSTLGTITGNVEIQGLPFAINATVGSLNAIEWANLSTNWVNIVGQTNAGTSIMSLRGATAAATLNLTNLVQGDLSNTSVVISAASYQV